MRRLPTCLPSLQFIEHNFHLESLLSASILNQRVDRVDLLQDVKLATAATREAGVAGGKAACCN